MLQLNNTTFRPTHGGDVRALITAGGMKDPEKFIPALNMSYSFGGPEEYYKDLNRTDKITTSKSEVKFDGEKVRLIEGSDIDEIYTDALGRVKWDVVFERCPESMVLEWRRTYSPGLTALYQPALTDEEIKEGSYRPDDVIGSYAIYCDKAHNWIRPLDNKKEIPKDWRAQIAAGAALGDVNISAYRDYKTGKVGHKYRPFVIDADGRTEWCTLLIVGNVERVTLPEEFMKTAKYPVRLDPTFGYTSAGASVHYQYTSDQPIGSTYGAHTAATGEIITNFHFYGGMVTNASEINFAAYSIDAGDLDSRLGTAVAIAVDSATAQWWASAAISRAMANGVSYGIAFECYGEASNGCYVHYDNGNTGKRHDTAESLPATWSNNLSPSRDYSIYATYSAGGEDSLAIYRHHYEQQGMM